MLEKKQSEQEFAFYSSDDIKSMFHISHTGLWRWVREGKFPKPARIGRRSLWSKDIIAEYVKSINA